VQNRPRACKSYGIESVGAIKTSLRDCCHKGTRGAHAATPNPARTGRSHKAVIPGLRVVSDRRSVLQIERAVSDSEHTRWAQWRFGDHAKSTAASGWCTPAFSANVWRFSQSV